MKIEDIDSGESIVEGHFQEEYFAEIVREYLANGKGCSGKVGGAQAHLLDAADLVGFAVEWLERRFGRIRNKGRRRRYGDTRL